jgi:hypothetical protein
MQKLVLAAEAIGSTEILLKATNTTGLVKNLSLSKYDSFLFLTQMQVYHYKSPNKTLTIFYYCLAWALILLMEQ